MSAIAIAAASATLPIRRSRPIRPTLRSRPIRLIRAVGEGIGPCNIIPRRRMSPRPRRPWFRSNHRRSGSRTGQRGTTRSGDVACAKTGRPRYSS